MVLERVGRVYCWALEFIWGTVEGAVYAEEGVGRCCCCCEVAPGCKLPGRLLDVGAALYWPDCGVAWWRLMLGAVPAE